MSVTVFSTSHDDDSAEFTIRDGEDTHKFSAAKGDESTAVLSYEESLSWRGSIRVSSPDQAVWKQLAQSEEMTEWLDENDLEEVRFELN